MNCVRASNYFDKEPPMSSFYVNSCGYFTDIDRATGVVRTKGRPDYQFIGIINGKMKITTETGIVCVNPGQGILFRPKKPQIYGMHGEGDGAYFWIHFDGTEADKIVGECFFKNTEQNNQTNNDAVYVFDCCVEYGDLEVVSEMMTEITQRFCCYQLRLQSIFIRFMTSFARRGHDTEEKNRGFDKIRPAIIAMERDGEPSRRVKEYADMCLMSEYYFMHIFKKTTGMTPMGYKNMIVMERVKSLLANTDLSLKEIAQRCYLADSIYLSKKFKQQFGCTPTQYRQTAKG